MNSTIKSRWNDADYEVGARTMEHFHTSDFQREPPLVSDTLPAARIFNWRLPAPKQPRVSQVIHTGLKLWHFVRLTISDFAYPVMCLFLGHSMAQVLDAQIGETYYMSICCSRCGNYQH